MSSSLETRLDEVVAAALCASDYPSAATHVLRDLGPEIFRFLGGIHRDEDDAADVFSEFTEALWKAIPSFERRCSVRTWAYAIARRVSIRHRRDYRRRVKRFDRLPPGSPLEAVETRLRTETLSFLRTERRSKLAALRESLPHEDQMLLVLRIDRKLAWNDLAFVLADDPSELDSTDAVKREAARLRKRFQVIKDRLRELGRREGLISAERSPDE